MKASLFALVAVCGLSACNLLQDDGSVDAPAVEPPVADTPLELATLSNPTGFEPTIGEGEETVTIGAYDYGNSRYQNNGGYGGFFTYKGESGYAVTAVSENFEVGAVLLWDRSVTPDEDKLYTGLSGTTALIPANGSAVYAGDWAYVERTMFGFGSQSGELSVDVDFANSTLTGTGTDSGGGTVLEIAGQTAANGTFAGSVTVGGSTFDTLEGGFFGDAAEELAGTFTSDGRAGVITAKRNDTE